MESFQVESVWLNRVTAAMNIIYSRPLARLSSLGNNLKTRRYNTTIQPPLAFAFDIVRTRLSIKARSSLLTSGYRRRTASLSEERMHFLLPDAPSKYWKGITISGSECYYHCAPSMADFWQKNSIHPCRYLASNSLCRNCNISLIVDKWWRRQ